MAGFLGGSSGSGGGGEILFPAEFIDPVTKLRVSEPETLIDTDFEYGLQPTKWETVELINNTPSFFSKSGDTTINGILAMVTTATSREVKVTTAADHGLAVGIPINVSGTKSITADGSYIINSIPDPRTFTYLAKQNQDFTASIFDLYTSIITGEFFQGSQIKISDSQGIVTNAGSPSALTVQTDSPHGFQVGTPFYFLNLNSTVSQQFDASNTGAKTFDSSNSATAQTFDGSNSLTSYNVDFDNRAYVGGAPSATVTHSAANKTITVLHGSENFSGKPVGTPLYYNAPAASSGYFFTNPRGIVFIADSVNNALGTSSSTFAVSATPGGELIDLPTAPTGFFQLANQAVSFAGNNIDLVSQTTLNIVSPTGREFDGANSQGSLSTVNTYSGTIIQLNNDAGTTISTGLYVGAMVFYTTTGTAASGLTNNTTYFVTYYNEPAGSSVPGFLQIKVATLPGGADISVSGGSGTQKFRKIGVSVDRNIWNLQSHGFVTGDLVRYTYPVGGKVALQSYTKDHAFVTRIDAHNFYLNDELGVDATGGTVSTINVSGVNYKVHRFVVDSIYTTKAHSFVVNSGNATADFLVVAGGGSGSPYVGGGGGGGGFIEGTMAITSGSTYTVTVGGGGNPGPANTRDDTWQNGSNSSISGPNVTITAIGGGRGGRHDGEAGYPGGSGGGAASTNTQNPTGGAANAGSWSGSAVLTAAGYAFRGGNTSGGRPNNDCEGAGGGGAGGIGQDHRNIDRSNGGPGRISTISGTSYYYAAGGGGGGYYPNDAGDTLGGGEGGIGGGGGGGAHGSGNPGAGGTGGETVGSAGVPRSTRSESPGGGGGIHTGSGGGSTGHSENPAGGGGSGIIYIRYPA
jgi:hypothetical protein